MAKTKTKKARKAPQLTVVSYLIIEKMQGNPYAYYESPAQFSVTEPQRLMSSTRLDIALLAHECDLNAYGNNFYFVQEIYGNGRMPNNA